MTTCTPHPAISEQRTPGSRWRRGGFCLAAGSLIAYALVLSVLSRSLDAALVARDGALVWLATAGIISGGLYIAGLHMAGRSRALIHPMWINAVAIIARLLVSASPPMLETDYYRYLWDGAVTAHAINPYRHAPDQVAAGAVVAPDGARLADVAQESMQTLERINHPSLTTIYPPIAQAAFAAAYSIAPFDPLGLRIVFCVADALAMLVLLRAIRLLNLPPSLIAWFAWNPILLREGYSALHMDVLLLPLLAGAILAAVRSRISLAAAILVVASAVKVWPIALLPLALRTLSSSVTRVACVVGGCVMLGALLWLPVASVTHGATSGFVAYGKAWQNNDGFFRAGIWVTEQGLRLVDLPPWHSHLVMRGVSITLIAGVTLWLMRTRPRDGADVVRRFGSLIGAIFLLSPTQFPWYWLWCLPFIALQPRSPLVLYAALLPLYYVQDHIVYPLGHWIQHVPVWAMMILGWVRGVIRHRGPGSEATEVSHA